MAVNVSPAAEPMRSTVAQRTTHVSVGFAAEAGAIIATTTWVIYGAAIMLFGLFGVDLIANIQHAEWTVGNAVTEFSAVYAPLFTYAIGILVNLALGALIGACYAWLHNLFAGSTEEM